MLLELDFSSQTPIYQQIRNQIVLAVAEGRLQPGERIPSMRTLADESGINMMTVNKAYQLLRQEGYLQIDRRSGARITLPVGQLTSPAIGDSLRSGEAYVSDDIAGSRHKDPFLRTRLQPQLALLISEARLHGVSQKEFLDVCRHIFQQQEEV